MGMVLLTKESEIRIGILNDVYVASIICSIDLLNTQIKIQKAPYYVKQQSSINPAVFYYNQV